MISRIPRGYWIWGQFDTQSTKLLNSFYLKVNNELNGPNFDVHLTISGPFPYEENAHTKIFENLSKKFVKLNIQLNNIEYTSEFFRSLFIDVAENETLNNLKNPIDNSFKIDKVEYSPHISLFYGIEDVAIKINMANKLKIPKNVTLDRLSIVKVDEESKSWKVLKSYSLS